MRISMQQKSLSKVYEKNLEMLTNLDGQLTNMVLDLDEQQQINSTASVTETVSSKMSLGNC